MVLVDYNNNQVHIHTKFNCEGIEYSLVAIIPPQDGEPGYINLSDCNTGKVIKAYPTKIGAYWSKEAPKEQIMNGGIDNTKKIKRK